MPSTPSAASFRLFAEPSLPERTPVVEISPKKIAAILFGFYISGISTAQTAHAASHTTPAGNLNLSNVVSQNQANDEIVYGIKKKFCLAGIDVTKVVQPILTDPPDAFKVAPSAPGPGPCVGMWVEADWSVTGTKKRIQNTCKFPAASIVLRSKNTYQELGRKLVKILRPVDSASTYFNTYQCGFQIPNFPNVITAADAASMIRPGGIVRWDVVIRGEPDVNNAYPVYDGLFLDEMVSVAYDECKLGAIRDGGGIINDGHGTNVWVDNVGFCTSTSATTLKHVFSQLMNLQRWRGCTTRVAQRFALGQCDFPGASVNNTQRSITQTHVFGLGASYHNERDDPPSSSPTRTFLEQ